MDRRAIVRLMGLGSLVGIAVVIAGGLFFGAGSTPAPGHVVSVAPSPVAADHYRGWSHLPLESYAHALAARGAGAASGPGGATPVQYVPMKHCDMQAHWAILSGSTVTC